MDKKEIDALIDAAKAGDTDAARKLLVACCGGTMPDTGEFKLTATAASLLMRDKPTRRAS